MAAARCPHLGRLGCRLHQLRSVWIPMRDSTFGRHLLITNMSISVLLSGLGDCLQQRYQMRCGQRSKYDSLRTCEMAGTGLVAGFFSHYWYIWLDRRLVGKTFSIVTKKVLVDQLLFSPVLITSFLVSLELIRGKTAAQIFNTIRDKFVRLYVAEWAVWPPAQAFSFYALPTRYRVLWDNMVSLGYDTYTSYVIHDVVGDVTAVDDVMSGVYRRSGPVERLLLDSETIRR